MEFAALVLSVIGVVVARHVRARREAETAEEELKTETAAADRVAHASAQAPKNEHIDPTVQSLGRMLHCLKCCWFGSVEEARIHVGNNAKSQRITCLNGVWKFKLFPTVDAALKHVADRNLHDDSIGYTDIHVPGSWQLQIAGDAPIYTNFKYIIPVDPPHVPLQNPTGYYERTFKLPGASIGADNAKEYNFYLCFGGVDSFLYMWINGQFVGFSKDSRLAADFDITSYLSVAGSEHSNSGTIAGGRGGVCGEVLVQAVVARYSDGHYLEDQDMFNLSGIFRDVQLYQVRKSVAITNIGYETTIKGAERDAQIVVKVAVEELLHVPSRAAPLQQTATEGMNNKLRYAVQVKLFHEGVLVSSTYPAHSNCNAAQPVFPTFAFTHSDSAFPLLSTSTPLLRPPERRTDDANQKDVRVSALGEAYYTHTVNVKLTVPARDLHLWTAETPHLYTLTVSLVDLTSNTSAGTC